MAEPTDASGRYTVTVRLEAEFLAHILLPDGSTVYDQVAPRLTAAYEAGDMPELLPGRPS